MAKRGSTQSRGSGVAGAEITTEQELDALLEPLLLVLEKPVAELVAESVDAIGQILSSGSVDAKQVRMLAETEDVLDELGRALEQVHAMVFGTAA
jgi:hypothetical protein